MLLTQIIGTFATLFLFGIWGATKLSTTQTCGSNLKSLKHKNDWWHYYLKLEIENKHLRKWSTFTRAFLWHSLCLSQIGNWGIFV